MNNKNKHLIAFDVESKKEYAFVVDQLNKLAYQSKNIDYKIENTDDGFTFIKVGNQSYPVEVVSNHQNEYQLLINGISYDFTVESPFSLERKKILLSKASESTTIKLKAPMPGKILEVMVKTGDVVKSGDTLLILEAMKMQNAILASTKGVIKKILVKEGDTTSKSDLLIELEKEA